MDTTAKARPRRRLSAGRVLRSVATAAAMAVAAVVVFGKRDEIAGATSYFENLRYGWIVVAATAEALAIVAFAELQRRLLRAGEVHAGLGRMTAITFAGNALQNSLPGGGAWASVYAFRQFRRLGADDVLSTWMLVAVSGLSAVALAIIAALGLAMAQGDAASLDLVGVIVGVIVLAAGLVLLARRGVIGRLLAAGIRLFQRITGRPRGDVDAFVASTQERLLAFTPSRRDWIWALGMAIANWGWDCGCLALSFAAVDTSVPWRGLVLAYGAAQLAANLPITPGGLGVVEGSLTIALVAYGGSRESTVAAVLMYRLMSFWALLVIGWATLGALGWVHRRQARTRL